MGTKRNPGRFDCYEKADPNEPMFVLLGRDRFAAGLVRSWAFMRQRAGEEMRVVAEALMCSRAMADWCRRLGKEPIESLHAWGAEKIYGVLKELNEAEQTLGKALGYSWFKDDPENFPGATEADGVCVGPYTAVILAEEAASRIRVLEDGLRESLRLQSHYASLSNTYDGGERKQFVQIEEWLNRVKETRSESGTAGEVGSAD